MKRKESKRKEKKREGAADGGGNLAEDDIVGERRADVGADNLKNNAASENSLGEVIGVGRRIGV